MEYIRFLRANAAWLTVGVLLAFTSSYGQTFFISIYSAEIMETFGLTYGGWGTIYTIGTAASAALMIWAGALTDVFRVRVLAPAIFAALAVSCIVMSVNTAMWMLPVIVFALRFTGQGMCSQMATVSMARWFNANRGRALAIASMGFAVGTALLPYLFVRLKVVFDWRELWLLAAGLAILAILPVVLLLRHERTPRSMAEETASLGMDSRHWTRLEMLRDPLFWLLLPAIFGPAAWNTALFFWQVHLAEIKGWSHADFVALLPLFTLVSVVSTFSSGWAIDRFGSGWLMAFQGLPVGLGFFTLWASTSISGAAIAMALIAFGTGMMATVPGSFAAEFYGTRHLGGIKAIWTSVMVLGSAVGPGVTGAFIDLGWSFVQQSLAFGIYFCASAALLFMGVRLARLRLPIAA